MGHPPRFCKFVQIKIFGLFRISGIVRLDSAKEKPAAVSGLHFLDLIFRIAHTKIIVGQWLLRRRLFSGPAVPFWDSTFRLDLATLRPLELSHHRRD